MVNLLLLSNNPEVINQYLHNYCKEKQIEPNQIYRFGFTEPPSVEEFRRILKLLTHRFDKPSLFVLDNFETYSELVQNTFLKSLEEHQRMVFFVLTAKTSASILPTILSRCIVKVLPFVRPELDQKSQQQLKQELAKIQTIGLAASVIKLGLKDKKNKVLLWLDQFLNYGYQNLDKTKEPVLLANRLKKALYHRQLINNNNLDPETALDQVFLS